MIQILVCNEGDLYTGTCTVLFCFLLYVLYVFSLDFD